MTTTTATRYEVEPFLFGDDYPRPVTPDAADYWTVYTRDTEGLAQAQADVRTLSDALAWVSLVVEHDAPVSVRATSADVLHVTLAPVESRTAATDLAALLFDVPAAQDHATTCGCEDGMEPTPEPGAWVTTTEATTARYVGTAHEFHVPPGVKLLVDHVFPTTHETIVAFPETPRSRAMTAFIPTSDLTWDDRPAIVPGTDAYAALDATGVRTLTQDEAEAAGLDTRDL